MYKENNGDSIKLKYRSGFKLIGKNENVLINTLIGCNKIDEIDDVKSKLQELIDMKNKTDR